MEVAKYLIVSTVLYNHASYVSCSVAICYNSVTMPFLFLFDFNIADSVTTPFLFLLSLQYCRLCYHTFLVSSLMAILQTLFTITPFLFLSSILHFRSIEISHNSCVIELIHNNANALFHS